MILCIPFLACDPQQFDSEWLELGFGVEASLFDRRDILDDQTWQSVCHTVRGIADDHKPSAFIFHFPVNDCDYIEDRRINDRLLEAIDLVADSQLDGLVLHSNRIRSVEAWRRMNLARERDRFAEYVSYLRCRVAGGQFWIGLENMPIMGNDATELDPLLVFPADFAGLTGGNIGITWDFCHYSYSVHVATLLRSGRLPAVHDYVAVPSAGFFDFHSISADIVHHHFSAFRGIAARDASVCVEGVPPWAGTVGEDVYAKALELIGGGQRARTITLEIREDDYRRRSTVHSVARWCRDTLRTESPGR